MSTNQVNNIPESFIPELVGLAYSLGGLDKVARLPLNTILKASLHPDDVIGITLDSYGFELTGIIADYEVFDSDLKFLYAADHIDGKWGLNNNDVLLTAQINYGNFFYIGYETAEEERFIMVIKA